MASCSHSGGGADGAVSLDKDYHAPSLAPDLSRSTSRLIRSVLVLKGELGPEAIGRNHAWALENGRNIPLISLQFTPWFVDKVFQQWHVKNNLQSYDRLLLLTDFLVWIAALLTVPHFSWEQLYIIACLASSILFALLRQKDIQLYNKHRSKFTAFKRLCPPLFWKFESNLTKTVPSARPWSAVFWHLGVQTGAIYCAAVPLFYLEFWNISALQSILMFTYIANTAAPACQLLKAHSSGATNMWLKVAGLFSKAAFGAFKHSMEQEDAEEALCKATANTLQVLAACLAISVLYWLEWGYRLRYKATLPPALQRMQRHLYKQPLWLYAAQVVVLVLYPAVVTTWVTAGLWYGLRLGS